MSADTENQGAGGARNPRKTGSTFAEIAKAARERDAKVRRPDGDTATPESAAPDTPEAQALPTAGDESDTTPGARKVVHVRSEGTHPLEDSGEQRQLKPRSAARTIHVTAPPPIGLRGARPPAPPVEPVSAPVEPEESASPQALGEEAVEAPEAEAQVAEPAAVAADAAAKTTPTSKTGRTTGVTAAVREIDIESRATATRTKMRAEDFRPRTNPTVVFFVVLGWIYAVGALIGLVVVINKADAFAKAAPQSLIEEKEKWEGRLQAEKGRMDGAQSKVDAKVAEAAAQRKALTSDIQALEAEIAKHEAKRDSIYKAMARIQEDFKPTGREAMDTQAKLDQAKEEFNKQMSLRGKMYSYYNRRWGELSQGFWKAMKDPQAATMSKFYDESKNTTFGAAAAFFAAEKYYKANWPTRAKSLYLAVQKDHSNTPYAAFVPERMQQLEAKADYKPVSCPVAPFVRFELAPITDAEKEAKRKRDEEQARRKAEEERKKAEAEAKKKAKAP